MLGNYCDTNRSSFMHQLTEVLGNDFGLEELAAVDLFEEDVRIFTELENFMPEKSSSRTLVMRDVYLDSYVTDRSPDRSGALFSWDHSPDRGPSSAKRMKSINGGFGSSCSSPAMSEASDDGLPAIDGDDFSVGSSPVSGMLMENLSSFGDNLFDSLCWMGDDDPLFPLSTPPSPADGSLPWERNTDRRKRDSKQTPFHSCSANNMWNSAKKWSQLRHEEKRDALSGLISIIDDLGVRERLDLNHILNIKSTGGGPVVIGLNSLNDDKWRQVKTYMKKLTSLKSGKDSLSKPRNNGSSQLRAWQPSDHIYAPLKRPSPSQPSCRVQFPPAPPPPLSSVVDSQAQSRLSADPLVSSNASASRDSSSNRRPTSNVLSSPSKSHCVPSKKDFPKDKKNIIKARRKGVNRKYQPSKNSILKKDVIQKITQNANRVTKKGLRMQVDEKDVEQALSGCFDQEEMIVLDRSSCVDVDEYIDVQA